MKEDVELYQVSWKLGMLFGDSQMQFFDDLNRSSSYFIVQQYIGNQLTEFNPSGHKDSLWIENQIQSIWMGGLEVQNCKIASFPTSSDSNPYRFILHKLAISVFKQRY
jgi:hypothetical protein